MAKDPRRLLAKHFSTEKDSQCWTWTGSLMSSGYGQFWLKGKIMGAHRASYILHVGDIAEGNVIMHTCDKKLCINPSHLMQGTQQQNIDDMHKKGRACVNEKHYLCKVTSEDVQKIKDDERTHQTIANSYGLSRSYVTQLKQGVRRGRI